MPRWRSQYKGVVNIERSNSQTLANEGAKPIENDVKSPCFEEIIL